jgi:NADPH:quinone reductase-like Zn-dependent oxidoreductase
VKALQLTGSTGRDAFALTHLANPTPGPAHVLIRVEAAGVNYGDLLLTSAATSPQPVVPGYAVAGTVTAVGPGVPTALIGTRVVAPLTSPGGYAEQAVTPAVLAVPLPPAVEATTAVAIPIQGLTSYLALRDTAQLAADDGGLITAAAGGVGHLAVQLARLLGARRVVAAVGSPDKAPVAHHLGADDVIITRDPDAARTLPPPPPAEHGVEQQLSQLCGFSGSPSAENLATSTPARRTTRLSSSTPSSSDAAGARAGGGSGSATGSGSRITSNPRPVTGWISPSSANRTAAR